MTAKQTPTPEQRIAADPWHSAWVGASAGSGKTQVLTDRLMRLLLTGIEPASILCLTYTKAGASEMATRMFARLSVWSTCSDAELHESIERLAGEAPDAAEKIRARGLFARALETPGGLKVQTIHAFCERLLQLFPIEAGLVPGFRVLDETETAKLMRDAITQSLMDDDESVAEGWAFLSEGDLGNLEALQKTMSGLLSGHEAVRRALQKENGAEEALLRLAEALELVPLPDKTVVAAKIETIDVALYRDLAQRIEYAEEFAPKDKAPDRLREIANADVAAGRTLAFTFFFTEKGTPRVNAVRKVLAASAGVTEALAQEQARLVALYDELWRLEIFEATLAVYRAAANVLQRLDRLKRMRGLYDFDDLIARTRSLLSTSAQAQWVLYKLDSGLTHVLVDEAQDTSPAQWQIIMALVEEFFAGEGRARAETRTVFVVGDRKQSIFSFQGADVRAFEAAKATLSQRVLNGNQKLQDVNLAVSYRSLALVLKSVDAVFAKGRPARAGFGVAGDDEPDHTAHRKHAPGLVEVWPLVEPPDKQEPDYWQAPVDKPPEGHPRRILARQIAEEIASWIGRRVLPGRDVPVQPGDIMILLQSRNLLFSALIAELRRLNVPVAGADRLALEKNIITADLMMLIQWLTLPGDDHALACVLKSPLVPEPVSEDVLFVLAHGRGDVPLWARLDAQSENHLRLESYRALAAHQGPYGFLAGVTQLCRRAILQRLGSEAEDAIREVLELALDFERREAPSHAGFAQWFSTSEHVVKREMDPKGREVRIMTVHGAKGLEAPIVFLADAADTGRGQDNTRLLEAPVDSGVEGLAVFVPQLEGTPDIIRAWKDAAQLTDQQERLRLLYVGMTRAMDALYVCGSISGKSAGAESWWSHVSEAFGNGLDGVERVTLADGRTVQRLGDGPLFVEALKLRDQEVDVTLPDWTRQMNSLPPHGVSTLHFARDENAFDSPAARQGIAIHRFFELAPHLPAAQRAAVAKRLGLGEEIGKRLMALLDDPALAVFFGVESEAEVVISGGGLGLRRIDRLARRDGVIHLLDFKSGQRPVLLGAEHGYVRQMADYAALLRDAYPGTDVRAALLWTQDGQLDWISADWLAQA